MPKIILWWKSELARTNRLPFSYAPDFIYLWSFIYMRIASIYISKEEPLILTKIFLVLLVLWNLLIYPPPFLSVCLMKNLVIDFMCLFYVSDHSKYYFLNLLKEIFHFIHEPNAMCVWVNIIIVSLNWDEVYILGQKLIKNRNKSLSTHP